MNLIMKKIRKMESNLNNVELQNIKELGQKGLNLWSKFLWFDNEGLIKLILSQLHNDCIVLDKPYLISKYTIFVVTGLCDKGTIPMKKFVKNKEVETITKVMGDQRALLIKKIVNLVVRYIAYEMSYKIYFKNREGSTSAIDVFVAHKLVMEDADYNLCELLRSHLLENINMKKNEGYPFQFGSLLVCLTIYFLRSLSLKENVLWKSQVPVAKQFFQYLKCLENKDEACKDYFKTFQEVWILVSPATNFAKCHL